MRELHAFRRRAKKCDTNHIPWATVYSTHRFATTLLNLPLAGALASNNLEQKDTKPHF